jgi:hypothetical protein
MRHKPTTSHNYQRLLEVSIETSGLARLAASTAIIQHDDYCDLLNDCGFCNCEPRIIHRAGINPAPKDAVASEIRILRRVP